MVINMEIAAALLGALLLYRLQKFLYSRFWDRNLTVELSLSEKQATEGEELTLNETVINQKLLPIPALKIKYMTSRHLSFLDMKDTEVTDNTYRNDLVSVMMYQKLTRRIPFVCSKRGYYSISRITFVCSDLLFESDLVAGENLDLHLYVYPRPVDSLRMEVPFQNMMGTVLTKRFINEDPFEFKSIREYQSYDTMKTINWKASAKTGSLMVNVYDHTASQQIKILLNLESDTIWLYEDLQEESIRLAATFAHAFIEQGIPVSLYTNGLDVISKEVLHVPAGSGKNHLRTINETLARIDALSPLPSFTSTVGGELENGNPKDYLLLISSYQRLELQERLEHLSRSHIDFMWIVPANREVRLTVEGSLLSHVQVWETED
ncbi:uncharacterized protein (DUF58 family) [Anaerotaenia torta]